MAAGAGNVAIGPQEDEAVIKQRLLTRTVVTRGEPPLKKLLKRFCAFIAELDKEGLSAVLDSERAYRGLLLELATFDLPLAKTQAVIDANQREQEAYGRQEREISTAITQVAAHIEVLKGEVEVARAERRHEEECEKVRELVAAQRPRSESRAAIAALEAGVAALEAENAAAAALIDLRRKQFSMVFLAIEELQAVLEEEEKGLQDAQQPPSALLNVRSSGEASEGPSAVDPMAVDS